jgi:hypothetical protein
MEQDKRCGTCKWYRPHKAYDLPPSDKMGHCNWPMPEKTPMLVRFDNFCEPEDDAAFCETWTPKENPNG